MRVVPARPEPDSIENDAEEPVSNKGVIARERVTQEDWPVGFDGLVSA
jgi:hypothetical protein